MIRRRIASVSLEELRDGLSSSTGIFLSISPWVIHVQSEIQVVAEGIYKLYAEHEFWMETGVFADFRIKLVPHRKLFRPLCVFEVDERRPFTPLAIGEAFALFEWGLNWCVSSHCHEWITIHSAVLESNGRALILPAPPGSGKSTLCSALMHHGWRLLSDEMALLDPLSGDLIPSPRPISLKNASIDVMRRRVPEAVMGPVAFDTLKGTVCHMRASTDSVVHAQRRALPAWIVFPRYEMGAPLTLSTMGRALGLMELQRNSFNRHIHGHHGFHVLADVVDQCAVHQLVYSDLDDAMVCMDALALSRGNR